MVFTWITGLARSIYVLMMTSQSIAQGIMGPDICYAGSLDIDYIHDDIHG